MAASTFGHMTNEEVAQSILDGADEAARRPGAAEVLARPDIIHAIALARQVLGVAS